MNFRERYFLMGIVAFIVIILLVVAFRTVTGSFSSRYEQIARLEREVSEAKKFAFLGEKAKRKIADYQARSLPRNPEVNGREYSNWLFNQVEKAGLSYPDIKVKPDRQGGDLFVEQEFDVQAKGGLPQVVELLHAFYSQDWLHRITRLSIQPVKDTKLVDFKMSVETLSLKKAEDTPQLKPRPSKRLLMADSKAYYNAIVGRNLFGPANNPPRVNISGNRDVYLGRDADLTLRANDADVLDKNFTYTLIGGDSKFAKLDPKTGRFSWRPNEIGKYEFQVQVTDDGYPAKTSPIEKIVINVREQTRPERIKTGFEGFDKSKFTVFTAVLDVEGQGEIWLYNRPDGEMLKLHPGDKFEVGSIKGTVAEIGEYEFLFDNDGKRLKLAHGENLFNAKVVGDTPGAAPPVTVETSTPAPAPPSPAEQPAPPSAEKPGEGDKAAEAAPAEAPASDAKAG